MRSSREYLERAAECRLLAAQAKDPIARQLLIETAETWEFLASQDLSRLAPPASQ